MALVVLFLVLSFATIFGGYAGNNPYDDFIFFKSIIDYIILVASMMAIPFIYKIVKSDDYDIEKGKKICGWNIWIVLIAYFCLDVVLMQGIYDQTIQNFGENLVYALMFYYINRRIFCHNSNESSNESFSAESYVEPKEPKKKRNWFIIILIILLVLLIAFAVVGLLTDNSNDIIEYESYYVGVRTISVDDETTAQIIVSIWEENGATEDEMIALMDKYGASQGGGQLYIIEPGYLIEEVNDWCFDRNRKVGDVAIIKNAYGYTICYFSTVIER